jgi:hypothetical protein
MSAAASGTSWSPRRAAKFSRDRIARIDSLLSEIADTWGAVDPVLVDDCDRMKGELKNLLAAVEYAGGHHG